MIVGTAGHIDHGKTLLVKALTGIDTDRLKEEKARGITIELGFAYLPLDDGSVLGFIDVPGHERFVHTMLAGATGIDFVLLIVAADDGVMPQTREHLDIIDILGIREGIVVLTNARATNIFNEAVRFRLLEMVYDQPYEIEEQVQFNWAQILKQAQDQAAMLGEVVALDTVAPFLGDWRNDALGPVTLYLDGETLLLDTGDFTSEVRPFAVADADAGRHVLFHMPLAGLSVHLGSDDDGSRQIVLGSGVAEYVFTRID